MVIQCILKIINLSALTIKGQQLTIHAFIFNKNKSTRMRHLNILLLQNNM